VSEEVGNVREKV